MENLFLNIITSLSDYRHYIGPFILFCVTIIAGATALEAMGIDFRKHKNE